jgi:hypothetical protein
VLSPKKHQRKIAIPILFIHVMKMKVATVVMTTIRFHPDHARDSVMK